MEGRESCRQAPRGVRPDRRTEAGPPRGREGRLHAFRRQSSRGGDRPKESDPPEGLLLHDLFYPGPDSRPAVHHLPLAVVVSRATTAVGGIFWRGGRREVPK